MGKASRTKRRRAAVRSAKRSRNNNAWYALTALVVIAGISLVVYAKATQPASVGPYVLNQQDTSDPHNKDSHWHAALGVYDCDHWVGDLGNGTWSWPGAGGSPTGPRNRANETNVYAGLHSHEDGIIHMEPQVSEEAGHNATVGKYFDFGGWSVSSTGYNFDGTKAHNGDKCGATPGHLEWEVAKFNGNVNGAQAYAVKTGDPGSYKLYNDNIVVIAFVPDGKTVQSLGNPPSLKNLPDAGTKGEQAMQGQTQTPTQTPATAATSTPTSGAASTPTSGASTATTKP
jgi:hypothetical protein